MIRIVTLCLLLTTSTAYATCWPVEGHPDQRTCDLSTLDALKSSIIEAEKARDTATADVELAKQLHAACGAHVKAIEPLTPAVSPTPWAVIIGSGAIGLLTGIVVTTLVVRAVR